MGRVLAWLMIITGSVILGFNGYKWWGEINIAVRDPKVAMTIADDWQETKQEPSLTTVDNLATVDEEFNPSIEELSTDEENTTEENNDGNNNQSTDEESTNQEQEKVSSNQNDQSKNNPNPSTQKSKPKKKPTTKLKVGSQLGQLIIPKTGSYLPIVEGTDDASLKKGVGKYRGWGTVSPDQTGHVVLSGHRNTVLPKSVGKLVNGDKMYVTYKNRIYTYQIRKTWVTHADDRTVIVPIERPVLTVTTCFPFDYKGDAPDRYIIRADLIRIQNNA